MEEQRGDKPLFVLKGRVVHGKHLGTRLGFPTANIACDDESMRWPRDGVYIAIAETGSVRYVAVLNQGAHPTAPEGGRTVEAHLLGYPYHEMYGQELTLSYMRFVRGEKKYQSLDALKAQLKLDRQSALDWAQENQAELYEHAINGAQAREGASDMDGHEYPIQVENVSYQYDADSPKALDGVSLSVQQGGFVAVLGHNGSGKSTLAKLMNALFLPTEGRVLVCGMDAAAMEDVWNVRKHAGMVFQNPDNQIVANVVREDVAFGLENLGVPQEDMIPRIDAALAAVRMTDFASSAPHMLSGGQKQRVAVAGVLAMQPEVMILDEATAMLDPSGRKEVLQTVQKLNRERGMTVIWITHHMEEAAVADRVVVLDNGKIAMDGTPAEVFSQVTAIKALGLDVPPMAELALELRKRGIDLPDGVLNVADMVKELKKAVCPSK